MRYVRTISYLLLLFVAFDVSAERNLFKLGEGAGAYFMGIAMLQKASESECGDLIPNPPSVEAAIQEISPYFNQDERIGLHDLARSPDLRSEAEDFVSGFLSVSRADGLSKDARCGFLLGVLATAYSEGRERWKTAKSLYSR